MSKQNTKLVIIHGKPWHTKTRAKLINLTEVEFTSSNAKTVGRNTLDKLADHSTFCQEMITYEFLGKVLYPF
jgi:hypothetical protein